jgi:molybdopterin converting factor small subunit
LYISVKLEVARTKEEELVLTTLAKVEHAITQAVSAHPDLSKLMGTIRLLSNGQWAAGNAELKDGDRVTLLPPVGGG